METKTTTKSYGLLYSLLFYGLLSFISWMAAQNFLLSSAIMILPLVFYQMSKKETRRRMEMAAKSKEKVKMDALALHMSKKLH